MASTVLGAWLVVASSIAPSHAANAGLSLMKPHFKASGRGNVTTSGSIGAEQSTLWVGNKKTWLVDQGIRIARAGDTDGVHDGEPPDPDDFDAPEWVGVDPNSLDPLYSQDRKEGHYSVQCRMDPSVNVSVSVDVCGLRLAASKSFDFDELFLWVKPSVAMAKGALQIVLFKEGLSPDEPAGCCQPITSGELELPALTTDWNAAFARIQGEEGVGAVREIRLRCNAGCSGLNVNLDQVELTSDLIGFVGTITPVGAVSATFALKDGTGQPLVAKRDVVNETVFHDDTRAVQLWLDTANDPDTDLDQLYAPNGVYLLSKSFAPIFNQSQTLGIWSDTRIRCQSNLKTTFKNSGGSATGLGTMFRGRDVAPSTITVQNCGFDSNGWNRKDYLAVLSLGSASAPDPEATNVSVLDNNFFDSAFPGKENCKVSLNACATLQRQYVLVQGVHGAWILRNRLAHGGRIKAGGQDNSGDIHIQFNTLDFVNDNGITVVQRAQSITTDVEVTDNTVIDPIGAGVYLGDDIPEASTAGLKTYRVKVLRNKISGFFQAGVLARFGEIAEDITISDNEIRPEREGDFGPFSTGITVVRGAVFADPFSATRITFERNKIYTKGDFGLFSENAVLIDGALSDLTLVGNEIGCTERFEPADGTPDPCPALPFEKGLRLRNVHLVTARIAENIVADGNIALMLGNLDTAVLLGTSDLSIDNNQFLDSKGSKPRGQITIEAGTSHVFSGQIYDNQIHGGLGWAIACRGEGTFSFDIGSNDLSGNAGEIDPNCSA